MEIENQPRLENFNLNSILTSIICLRVRLSLLAENITVTLVALKGHPQKTMRALLIGTVELSFRKERHVTGHLISG